MEALTTRLLIIIVLIGLVNHCPLFFSQKSICTTGIFHRESFIFPWETESVMQTTVYYLHSLGFSSTVHKETLPKEETAGRKIGMSHSNVQSMLCAFYNSLAWLMEQE